MTLIDTSSWIEQLRTGGDKAVRARVESLLVSGEAAWCPVVRLELWNGARGLREYKVLREIDRSMNCLEITAKVWDRATELARLSRERGITTPSTDLLVAACAQVHSVELEHTDKHFNLITSLAAN